MLISQNTFSELLRGNRLVITMLGMSNVGKSFWSRRFARYGFSRIGMDDIIMDVLYETGTLTEKTDAALALWLGMPDEERFAGRQKILLAYEAALARKIAEKIEQGSANNTVIDPGGSIIYVPQETQNRLKAKSLVVYIEATDAMKKEMFEKFIQHPKALIWGDTYIPKEYETRTETLARCYPLLLESRVALYRKMADITLPHIQLPHTIRGDELLERVRTHLR